MMTLDRYRGSLRSEAPPDGLTLAQEALWWAGKGQWDAAHGCAQRQEGDPACDWVHAYLHRVEDDLGNARYWYDRAGKPAASGPLDAEWASIAAALVPA